MKVVKEISKILIIIILLIGIMNTLNTISSYENREQSIIINETLPNNKVARKVSYTKSDNTTITVQEALDELATLLK